MRIFISLISFGFLVVVLAGVLPAYGDDYTVSCLTKAPNEAAIAKIIKAKVLAAIDSDTYSQPKVKVTLRLISIDTSASTKSDTEILSGVTIQAGSFPTGLSFGVSGGVTFDKQCQYTYFVTIRTSAIETESGLNVASRTESTLTLVGSGIGRLRRSRNSDDDSDTEDPTPTPTSTPTPTPTPEEEEG